MKKINVMSRILFVLCLLLAVGPVTFLKPCGAHDGAYASCHWAGNVIFAMGICLTLEACLLAFGNNALRAGVSICMAMQAVLTALIPGVIVSLCKMETMHCNLIMKPGTLVLSVLIFVLSVADFVFAWKQGTKEG